MTSDCLPHQVRLRRWDPLHGTPEQPLTNSELDAEAKQTLSTLCLAPRAAVLFERRSAETAAATWPAPTPDDLYLRVRRWAPTVPTTARPTSQEAAAAAEGAAEGAKVPTPASTPASTPAFTPAFTELERLRLAAADGGGAHHGAGTGSVSSAVAGDRDVSTALPPSNMSTISSTMISSTTTTNNKPNDSSGTAAAAVLSDALPYDEGIEGPVQLLCVPNGRSNHAYLITPLSTRLITRI